MRLRLTATLSIAAALALAAPAISAADAVTAVTAKTKVMKLGKQKVGYRTFGSGRPLVMIMGLAGSMDSWDPTFLDALAKFHRIVLLDNEGVGKSTSLKGPLTIRRMADTTARVMAKLKLRGADVAGWSMGGMIAQSLVIRHPKQVRELTLMATAPGDGHAVAPTATALQALQSPSPLTTLNLLFPPGQEAARDTYVHNILLRQPNEGTASMLQIAKQTQASATWMLGQDPDGRKLATIRKPTLVGGGELDQLLPIQNQRWIGAQIASASVDYYPDAAHGFFLQHQDEWVHLMLQHMSG
jgi:pimeloyl-ACP methyl ester carboxylesterase